MSVTGFRAITRGAGVYLWDDAGNCLLDAAAGGGCINLGYGRKALAQAAAVQMEALCQAPAGDSTAHPTLRVLSQRLHALTPHGLDEFFFCHGDEPHHDAVLRLIALYWRNKERPEKKIVIACRNSYHDSGVGGHPGGLTQHPRHGPFLRHNTVLIDQPDWYGEGRHQTQSDFGLARARQLESAIISIGAERIAAFMGEPFQARGAIFPPHGYWPEIERICRKYDVLLVADESSSAFGRSGEWFAHTGFAISPDLMTLGSGLTSGYLPMSAVALRAPVASALTDNGYFPNGLAADGHPVCAAVAIANLQLLEDENIIRRVRDDSGPYFQRCLREALEGQALVGQIDGVGLVAGLPLMRDASDGKGFDRVQDGVCGREVAEYCRHSAIEKGLLLRAWDNRLILSPPLILSHSEIDELISKITAALRQTAQRFARVQRPMA